MHKKIMPIIIVTILVGYFSLVMLGILNQPAPNFPSKESLFFILGILFLLYLIVSLIITLVRRLKEIDEEDQDDLSKY